MIAAAIATQIQFTTHFKAKQHKSVLFVEAELDLRHTILKILFPVLCKEIISYIIFILVNARL